MGTYTYEKCRFNDAKPGQEGLKILNEPNSGNDGRDGSITLMHATNRDEYTKVMGLLSKSFSMLYFETSLRHAETLFANNDIQKALDELTWLGKLLIDRSNISSNRESHFDYGSTELGSHNTDEYDSIRSRVFQLINRISQGLDYYGNSPNYVPLVDYSFYSSVLDSFILHARKIESNYFIFSKTSTENNERISIVESNINQQTDIIGYQKENLNKINGIEKRLIIDIEYLTNEYENKWYNVLKAGDEFKKAVQRESNNCSFSDVLKSVATIAISIKTMGAGLALASEAFKTYNDFDKQKSDPKDRLGNFAKPAYRIEKIGKIGSGVSEIAKGMSTLKDVLNKPNPNPNLPSDAGKLIMSRNDLERTLEPFRHLPEAAQYLKMVDEFIELVTTRNNKILEYNGISGNRAEIEFDIQKQEAEIGRMRKILTSAERTLLPELTNFMARSNLYNKKTIIQLLYSEHKALEYWAGNYSDFTLNRDTVDHLSQIHENIKLKFVEAVQNRGRSPEVFVFDDKIAKYSFLNDLNNYGKEKINEFKSKSRVFFFLPDLRYTSFALVRFSRVKLKITGIRLKNNSRGNDPSRIILTHFGSAKMRSLNGEIIEFNHEPRSTTLSIDVQKGETIRPFSLGTDSGEFIKLTPNGPWSIEIIEEERGRIDLSNVKNIELSFEGEFFTIRQ
jgi:hypothetical protein